MSESPGSGQRSSIFDTLQLVQAQTEANRVMNSALGQSRSERSVAREQ